MTKKIGTLIIVVGLMCLAAASVFFFRNQNESKKAGESANAVLAVLTAQIEEEKKAVSDENNSDEELNDAMPTVNIDGYDYIGFVEIPKIGIKLPVMSDWDYDRLKIAPCRNFGSVNTNDLVIAGHNYTVHFGKLDNLTEGDTVIFTDVKGKAYSYAVQKLDTVSAEDVDAVQNSGYDLVLYTCTLSGKERTSVFCNRTD